MPGMGCCWASGGLRSCREKARELTFFPLAEQFDFVHKVDIVRVARGQEIEFDLQHQATCRMPIRPTVKR